MPEVADFGVLLENQSNTPPATSEPIQIVPMLMSKEEATGTFIAPSQMTQSVEGVAEENEKTGDLNPAELKTLIG